MADVREPEATGPARPRRKSGKRRSHAAASGETDVHGAGVSETDRRPPGPGTGGRYDKTVKKSVTLRESVVEQIEARTGARGFSEFLDTAAERHLAMLKAQEIVDDHVERRGEFTPDELAEAEAAWHGE